MRTKLIVQFGNDEQTTFQDKDHVTIKESLNGLIVSISRPCKEQFIDFSGTQNGSRIMVRTAMDLAGLLSAFTGKEFTLTKIEEVGLSNISIFRVDSDDSDD